MIDILYIQNLLKKGIKALPEVHLKKEWEDVMSKMIVHSRGVKPHDLLNKTFPHEDEEIRKYRDNNYESITTGIFDRAFDNLYRALSESNWSIKAGKEMQAFLDNLIVNKVSWQQFLFKFTLRRRIEDPNGLLVVLPIGDGVITNKKQVDIKLELVLSANIVYWDTDLMIFKCNEYTDVLVRDTGSNEYVTRKEGEVYYAITENDYFKYYQKGKKEENTFVTELYYPHALGYVPYIILGGRPTGKLDLKTGEEHLYFNSDFMAFLAHANEAIRDNTLHQGVKVTSAYPIRIMDELPCDNPHCNNGWVYEEGKDRCVCNHCKGLGFIIPTSPHRAIITQKRKSGDPTQGQVNKPLEYVYPDVAILKFGGESCDSNLLRAERALNLAMIQLAQSGAAKEMDREDQYSMLFSFSDYWFDIVIRQTLRTIKDLRFPNDKSEIHIIKPVSFKIKDETLLLQEYTDAIQKQASYGLIADIYMDLIKKRFSGDPTSLKIETLCLKYDNIYLYTSDTKDSLFLSAVVTLEQRQISLNIYSIIRNIAYDENVDFLNIPTVKLDALIQKELEQYRPVKTSLPIAVGGGANNNN